MAHLKQSHPATCSRIARFFSRSLQLGVDLLLAPSLRDHFVLEVNAFGDLLPGALHEGQTTYQAELAGLAMGWCDEGEKSPLREQW